MQKEAKREIARVAATRIKDGDTIAVDVGTTTVHIADFIVEVNNVTVVTNSISAADTIQCSVGRKKNDWESNFTWRDDESRTIFCLWSNDIRMA